MGAGALITSSIVVANKDAEAGQQFVNILREPEYTDTFLEYYLQNMSQSNLNAAMAIINRMKPDDRNPLLENLIKGLANIGDDKRMAAIQKIEKAIASTNPKHETSPNKSPLEIKSALSTAYSGKIAGLVAEQNTASA
ncbi:hypothetical protein NO1_2296 [Candidatus Termititenax aidoneus]|uniref:Uncharacterized protein n=1 Tax=Termititenax aidoneus TaxID=2218524 RepID=A0A388TEQ5_TERA1|nr:hypothetical protein NO1_2296 [Candidatus Termititenax aidoneus]